MLSSPPSAPQVQRLRRALLAWYRTHRRDLAWRRTRDPYVVWVSEIMLQQTQVDTVRPYFDNWMQRFPSVRALAGADESEVLKAWEGLGYYSRARNLHRAARTVLERHAGQLPADIEGLRALPGIGPYSAGAIASIAFGLPAPIVDGNVIRVLSRLFGLRGDPARAPLKRQLWALAEQLVPVEAPSDFNQAMMELGATVCTPREPRCGRCPVRQPCVARARGLQAELPETAPRRETIHVTRAAAVVSRGGRLLIVQTAPDARQWPRLWQFPSSEVASREAPASAARRAATEATGLPATVSHAGPTVRHTVTHHRITLSVWHCSVRGRTRRKQGLAWARSEELAGYPMPAAHRRIARGL